MLRAFRSTCYHPLLRTKLQAFPSILDLAQSTFFCSRRSLLHSATTVKGPSRVISKSEVKPIQEDDLELEEAVLPQQVILRPYQVECIKAVLDELQTGTYTRLGVSAPTGSGKTSIFTRLISLLPPLRHPRTKELATRVLIIVNSIQLAHQTHVAISRAYPDWHIEIEQGTKHKASGYADVTIATFQTLGREGSKRLDKFETEYFKAVIVDEAHHAVSKTYLSILSRFDSGISESFRFPSSVLSHTLTPSATPVSPAPCPVDSSLSESTDPLGTNGSEQPEELATLPTAPLPPIQMKFDDLGRPRIPLLAFSATWNRADGLALGKVFEKIVYHAEWLDMIKSNWLSELKFTTLRISPAQGMNLDNVEVSKETGDFVLGSLIGEVDREEVNEIAVKTWLEKCSDRRSTLVFAISISHILSLTNTFRKYGVDARFVHQETKPAERLSLFQGFRNGDFKVLVNCGILTEGADFPSIDCILLLRPTKSQTLFLQMLGRGLRLSPETGKEDCLVIDMVASGERAGGMVCTPSLFGVDPEADIEGQSTSQLRRSAEARQDHESRNTSTSPCLKDLEVQYTEYETAFDYVSSGTKDDSPELDENGEEAGPVHVSRISKLAWIGCGEDVWVLELLGKGHVKIVNTRDGYIASLYLRLPPSPFDQLSQSRGPPSPYMTPRLLALHRSLRKLIRATDQYLMSKPEYSSLGLARNSSWRKQPASIGQQNYILKKVGPSDISSREIEGVWIGAKLGSWVHVEGLSKGQASDLISRTKHGGMSYVKKVKREYEKGIRDSTRGHMKSRKVGETLRKELEEVNRRKLKS
ncbi:hypothetical protein JCM3765_006731 [Sporobolomyces pararoseus]